MVSQKGTQFPFWSLQPAALLLQQQRENPDTAESRLSAYLAQRAWKGSNCLTEDEKAIIRWEAQDGALGHAEDNAH